MTLAAAFSFYGHHLGSNSRPGQERLMGGRVGYFRGDMILQSFNCCVSIFTKQLIGYGTPRVVGILLEEEGANILTARRK